MLPLIANALPSTPATPHTSAAGGDSYVSYLLSGTADASAASRQQLASAVLATPVAYFPGVAPQQGPVDAHTQRVAVPPPTGDYIEIPEKPAATPTTTPLRYAGPLTLGIPLTAQFHAQFLAQQPEEGSSGFSSPTREEKLLRGKAPSFGSAKGALAYGIAAARTAALGPVTRSEDEAEHFAGALAT